MLQHQLYRAYFWKAGGYWIPLAVTLCILALPSVGFIDPIDQAFGNGAGADAPEAGDT